MVQSLAPVWEEEARRAAARGEPAPVAPGPPPRNVRDLTKTDRLVSELSRRVAVAAAVEARDETGVPVGGALTLGDILREEKGEGRGDDVGAGDVVGAGQSQISISVIGLGESRSRSIDRGAFETQTPPGLVRRWSQDGRGSGDDPDAFLDAVRPANASSQDNGSIEPSSQGKAAAGSSQRARKKGRLSRTSRAFDPVDTDDVINEEAVTASQADPRRSVDSEKRLRTRLCGCKFFPSVFTRNETEIDRSRDRLVREKGCDRNVHKTLGGCGERRRCGRLCLC